MLIALTIEPLDFITMGQEIMKMLKVPLSKVIIQLCQLFFSGLTLHGVFLQQTFTSLNLEDSIASVRDIG